MFVPSLSIGAVWHKFFTRMGKRTVANVVQKCRQPHKLAVPAPGLRPIREFRSK